ncbi:MAG: DUF5615 family PIN-like protein [Dehalococcoidia bacterium]
MNLKLDENLGIRGRALLVAAGHDVATVAEQGLLSAPDPLLLRECSTEQRGLVTLDVGFGNPFLYPPGTHAGVAVLRLAPRPTASDLDLAVRTLVAALASREFAGRIWIVRAGKIREFHGDLNLPPDLRC